MPRGRWFDLFVAVDWSARATPATGRDSIWLAVGGGPARDIRLVNPPTRTQADAVLRRLLVEHAGDRVLVAIDVGLGYPAGTSALFDLAAHPEGPWAAMWAHLAVAATDDDRNRNNRFEVAGALNRRAVAQGAAAGPFWGCPPGRAVAGLRPTKPVAPPIAELRATELALRAAGRTPMSMWQLLGAGSVGGQSLTAIPMLERWRSGPSALPGRVDVWPYTTGFGPPATRADGGVVVAEVWPTAFDPELPVGMVRDAAQVAHVARALADADRTGLLASWCSPATGAHPAQQIAEEGWILGPQ